MELATSSNEGLGTLKQFKQEITHKFKKPTTYMYFYNGNRKLQILHTRFRMQYSDLHEDLFNKRLADYPVCRCGDEIDAEHYLIH